MRYVLTLQLEASCKDDAEAKKNAEELDKFLSSGLVKAALIGRGVSLINHAVTWKRKP